MPAGDETRGEEARAHQLSVSDETSRHLCEKMSQSHRSPHLGTHSHLSPAERARRQRAVPTTGRGTVLTASAVRVKDGEERGDESAVVVGAAQGAFLEGTLALDEAVRGREVVRLADHRGVFARRGDKVGGRDDGGECDGRDEGEEETHAELGGDDEVGRAAGREASEAARVGGKRSVGVELRAGREGCREKRERKSEHGEQGSQSVASRRLGTGERHSTRRGEWWFAVGQAERQGGPNSAARANSRLPHAAAEAEPCEGRARAETALAKGSSSLPSSDRSSTVATAPTAPRTLASPLGTCVSMLR